ncbi:MAG TPA: PAS domain S-box protein [Terriglobales bacterium]|jgi:PAS domain S-box-containing protein|nr:PAS domain S-box protein [Terriglobales bacterium]
MALHPVEGKRHFPEEASIGWDPIRRALEANVDWYRDLVEHSQDLLCVHDLKGRFLSINPVPARLLGYSVEEILRTPMRDFIDPRFRHEFDAYLREIERAGEAHGLLKVMTRSGEQRVWQFHNTLRTEGVPEPIVRGIAHDVTDRWRAEKALRVSNEQLLQTARDQKLLLDGLTLFRTLLDQSNDAIKVIDPESLRFLDVNEKSYLELGYSREELLSMTVFDIDPNTDESSAALAVQQLRQSGFVLMETLHRRKDGTTFPVEVNMRRVQLEREYVVAVSRNITARKHADDRLREFERVVENLEEMIVVIGRDGRYLLANRAALRYRGMSKAQFVGRHVTEVVPPEFYEMIVKEKLDESFAGHIVSYEGETEYPGLGVRDIACTYLPIEGSTGIDRVACVVRDVTERKQAEEALRNSEREQHKIAEQLEAERARLVEAQAVAKVGSWETELPSLDITWSQQTHRIFETDPATFCPRRPSFVKLVHPEDRAKVDAAFEASLEKGAPSTVEYRIVMADGRVKVLEERWKVFRDGQGRPTRLVGTCQDITERKRAAAMLQESELRFRTVYERSPAGIALVDSRTGRLLQVNAKFCEITGRTEEVLLQTDLAAITHPDDIALTQEYLGELADEIAPQQELEKRYLRPDGSVRWVRVLGVPMANKGEQPWHMGLVEDITERKKAEEAIARLVQEVCEAKTKLTEEKLYLEQEINTELGFGEIIGQSKALQSVMENVARVASSDATVLLLGETGTGKELIARAIHRLSQRTHTSFIKMNCAAIPSGLLESELFGNEKGAFTGAVSKKIGRLELADKGTLFLDEIGDISLSLQPKLLRVLQDQEFERLGGTQTLKVDFRLIAATNVDLGAAVREKEFRSDLYYRLNVFPIRVPPLRERREDIRLLVEHFVQKCARRMNKSITSIPRKTMDALMEWQWPGNVRELENFIERSVILTQGSVLVAPLSEMQPTSAVAAAAKVDETLETTEREHILQALRESRGQLGGLRGAATRLGLKRTTLQSKLKHLKIDRRSQSISH